MAHPELPWILDLLAYWWFRRVVSLFALLYLSFRFVGTISISLLISIFMYCPAIACIMVASSCTCAMLLICLFLYRILCVADPSWSLDFESLPCYHLPLLRPVSYMFLFNICISLANWFVIIYYLACYYLARPFYYTITCHLIIINLLPWLYLTLWLSHLLSCITCSDLTL